MLKRIVTASITVPLALIVLVGSGVAPALAMTGTPQWTIRSASSPTYFVPTVTPGRDEIQEITVRATGGQFDLRYEGREATNIPYDASAEEVQEELEDIGSIGKGDVAVAGGPGDVAGTHPYIVTLVGNMGDREVGEIEAFSAEEPEQLVGEVSVAIARTGATPQPQQQYVVRAINTGGASTSAPAAVVDSLPAGITATGITGTNGLLFPLPDSLSCTLSSLTCEQEGEVPIGDELTVTVTVEVHGPFPAPPINTAAVSGGGAESTSTSPLSSPRNPATVISSAPVPFGVSGLTTALSSAQAGAHPNLTTSFSLNQAAEFSPAGEPKDIELSLPAGFVGNPTAVPRCAIYDVINNTCPSDTEIGTSTVTFGGGPHAAFLNQFVYNITPYKNEPAAFAFAALKLPVRLDTSVLSNGDYGVHVAIRDISEQEPLTSSSVTLWGVPHELNGPGPSSFYNIDHGGARLESFGGPGNGLALPFLSSPGNCEAPLTTSLTSDPWLEPGAFVASELSVSPTLTGCDRLRFDPAITVAPTTTQAGSPSGYRIGLEVPQDEDPNGLATPDLQNATVTFPLGTVVSPSAAAGLTGCSEAQIELHSDEALKPARCPESSKIGTVRIKTPLLEEDLDGSLYIAQQGNIGPAQGSNPFGSLMAVYLTAEGSGVIVKLAGDVDINPGNGQVSVTFSGNPQLPFSDLSIGLFGGPHAALSNPSTCGRAIVGSSLTPYSSLTNATPTSEFEVSGCEPTQFRPSFSGGMTSSAQAGAYSPFSVTFSRTDSDQDLSELSVQTPSGLLGSLAQVPLCPEVQAALGTCSASSEIGNATVLAGPGAAPVQLPIPGQPPDPVFLTGPYKGSPFGLSIVVPAVAGPFNLGKDGQPVVVRASIAVDSRTSALTITSDPLPQSLDGIPLQVKSVTVNVTRAHFMFNPTDCNAMSVTTTLVSIEGERASLSSPFQAVNCATLPFMPRFSASTVGKTSKLGGASLDVKVSAKGGPQSGGGEANIRSVKVDLPKQLPSRLTTLQKACTEAQFNSNPAGCPKESDVGTAITATPVLANPLRGPAYLVSHGGEAFPDLEIVLQGEGITLILDGNTDIKKGITSSTFKSVPDAPISSFELKLPTGKFSILGTNLPQKAKYSLCDQTLMMPTAITGQNGAEIHESTKIVVSGCAKVTSTTRAQKLTAALKACRRDKNKSKRTKCQVAARKKYGPLKKQANPKKKK
jgi:hypothetical protein